MTKWEYNLTHDWSTVCDLGKEGWELITVTYTNLSTSKCYYLKKPIND